MEFRIDGGELWLGDCLERMKAIPSGSVDMVLCDLPYGTTAIRWDAIIPFEPLWREYWRVAKANAAIVLTAAQPFTSSLVMSQPSKFRDEWIWHKNTGSNFANAKRQPLREHESILVFANGTTTYNPILRPRLNERAIQAKRRPNVGATSKSAQEFGTNKIVTQYEPETRNPGTVIAFDSVPNAGGGKLHPTQKPVELFEYLIRTYSNPGDLVLDNCAGFGTTAIAAMRSGRRWLCIEKEPSYYLAACGRIWKEAA